MALGRLREGCLGFKYPILGFQNFCQRNLFQYNGKEEHSDFKLNATFGRRRDGTVERALASHQCGLGSNPGVDAICGLSLLLVLSFALRGFSPCTPVFPSHRKPGFSNSNSTRNQVDEEPLGGGATSKSCIY